MTVCPVDRLFIFAPADRRRNKSAITHRKTRTQIDAVAVPLHKAIRQLSILNIYEDLKLSNFYYVTLQALRLSPDPSPIDRYAKIFMESRLDFLTECIFKLRLPVDGALNAEREAL
ncbi:hypothetical protein GWI33_011947 [Rhynchophorus ferrugineus]|uniref:Uncharacterized protein n=1 Tax=Rhynchophorus ferrugineus TaxID=354439 RepID=A0A834ISA7_RHYFE|nr:hypothetical protein GWI33_011947 [Rhynchophorus ferrugineus]